MPVPTPLLWHLHRNLKKNLPIFTYYTPFTHCRPNAKMHLKKSCPHQHIVLVSYSMHFTSSYFLKLMQLYLSYICFYMTNKLTIKSFNFKHTISIVLSVVFFYSYFWSSLRVIILTIYKFSPNYIYREEGLP